MRTLKASLFATLLIAGQAQAELFYFHNDHLGTPQAVTDTSGTVVWEGQYSPFGEVTETISAVQQDLRFPGQLLDRETGLHYNYFRDYNPAIGRYVESDPIGLGGGVNTYGYAAQNSLRKVDPYGLVAQCLLNGGDFFTCVLPSAGESVAGADITPSGPFGPVCGRQGKWDATWLWPDSKFLEACENHDECYSTCGVTQEECDLQMCLDGACLYGYGLTFFGRGAFEDAQAAANCDDSGCHR